MESLKRIDTKFCYSLLTLDENNFSSLLKFMNDFREMFFEDNNHSLVVFLNSVCSMLNIDNVMSKDLSEQYYEFEIRDEYKKIIMKYQFLLRELIEKDLFFILFRVMSNESDYLYFMEFYNYLICNFGYKLQIMENLYNLHKKGISNFLLDFQGTMTGVIEISSSDQNVLVVSNLVFDNNLGYSRIRNKNVI